MNRRRFLLLLPVWVLVAVLLAFPLRETVMEFVIMPFLYLLWMLGLLYRAIPQAVLWILLVTVVLLSALSFVLQNISFGNLRPRQKVREVGPVLALAQNINRDSRGVYFKWQVARTLSEIAVDLQGLRTHTDSRILQFDEREVPPVVRRYLTAGLNTSFADYPMPGPFQPRQVTPFDVDLDPVLDYLESQTEMDDDRRRS